MVRKDNVNFTLSFFSKKKLINFHRIELILLKNNRRIKKTLQAVYFAENTLN